MASEHNLKVKKAPSVLYVKKNLRSILAVGEIMIGLPCVLIAQILLEK